jgi:hypothetical protein
MMLRFKLQLLMIRALLMAIRRGKMFNLCIERTVPKISIGRKTVIL